MQVNVPGDDGCRIAPGARPAAAHFIRRYHHRHHAAARPLLSHHVIGVFAEERSDIHIVQSGTREYLRVAGPAHALVALRAISRHIQEVAFLAPQGVEEQAIHHWIRGLDAAGLFQLRVHHAAGEIIGVDFPVPLCQFYESETVISEMRFYHDRLAIRDVMVFRFRRA